jgi:hypothetical protein
MNVLKICFSTEQVDNKDFFVYRNQGEFYAASVAYLVGEIHYSSLYFVFNQHLLMSNFNTVWLVRFKFSFQNYSLSTLLMILGFTALSLIILLSLNSIHFLSHSQIQ